MEKARNIIMNAMVCIALVAFYGCEQLPKDDDKVLFESSDELRDRDGNLYSTVKIADQVWMAENLNVSHFRNGDPILQVTSNYEWFEAGEKEIPAWRYYNDDPDLGEKYRKLYNAFAVNDPRGLAPEGWRLPSDQDWSELFTFISGSEPHKNEAGLRMDGEEEFAYRVFAYRWNDAAHTVKKGNWDDEVEGTNSYGLGALPGGYVDHYGNFYYEGTASRWWSTPSDFEFSRFRDVEFDFSLVTLKSGNIFVSISAAPMKGAGYSVRLIKE